MEHQLSTITMEGDNMDYTSVQYFRHACQNIVDNQDAKAVNWAVNRAKQGLLRTDNYPDIPIGDEELRTRALYILTNITHWRGPIASETRSILKNIKEVN